MRIGKGIKPAASSRPRLTDTLAQRLRTAIRQGALAPGARLPSSREYSQSLGVGRNTVLAAFDRLLQEGWLQARHGSGTYVSEHLPEAVTQERHAVAAKRRAAAHIPALSRRGVQSAAVDRPRTTAFAPGVPDVSEFPFDAWLVALQRASRRVTPRMLSYGQGGGLPALREALCEHLAITRGVSCAPGDIIITGGTTDSLLLCANLFCEPGDAAVVEQPGYAQAATVLRSAGLEVGTVPVDEEGLDPARFCTAGAARLLYFTPCRQYPLGAALSADRRVAVLAWARKQSVVLLEDDYDAEFAGRGTAPLPLRAAPGGEAVVLLGSFSKIMFPGLRIAYAVMPHALATPAQRAAARLFMAARPWEQLALADFLCSGQLRQHLLRMRTSLARKHAWFSGMWQRELGDVLPLRGDSGALHGVARLPAGLRDGPLVAHLQAEGFGVEALSSMCLERPHQQGLVIGHGSLSLGELKRLGPRLVRAVQVGLRQQR